MMPVDPVDILQDLLEQLSDTPEAVEVVVTETPYTTTIDIIVCDSDVGKVLGRRGSHADALRVIFGAIYGKLGKQLHLQVVDPKRR